MLKVEKYITLRLPIPEGNVALIIPEAITAETAEMLIEVITIQLNACARFGAKVARENTSQSALDHMAENAHELGLDYMTAPTSDKGGA